MALFNACLIYPLGNYTYIDYQVNVEQINWLCKPNKYYFLANRVISSPGYFLLICYGDYATTVMSGPTTLKEVHIGP